MTTPSRTAIRVDIVSDVVCPWCIIGFKQLEKALIETDMTADITWHPFELNPQMESQGENLREHTAAKYGTTTEGSAKARARITALGEELGFEFKYADDMRMYNTFLAHQLLHWAATKGLQHKLKMELFSAFFTRRLHIGDPNILASIAGNIGLDMQEALAILEDGRFAKDVRQDQKYWTDRGVSGVPAIIINQQHLVSGAQGVENYVSILKQLREEIQSIEDVKKAEEEAL
ncbi:MAG: DSBA oxidoreductase [marine bacterium B5-7]|nr:MAG: DSBA oxidoreductase [marine bacterium B5-7]